MFKRLRNLLSRHADGSSTETASSPEAKETDVTDNRPRVHHGPKVVHRPIPHSEIDPDAIKIIRRLTRFHHTAYLVGGCVRDLLLERRPKDFDIGTTATPRQVKRVFSNCRIIGRRFRLAHVYFQNGKIIEVATFRARDLDDESDADVESDGDILIRDDNVFGTPEEDALRRDFTINALFYDVTESTVLDHVEGLGDLRRRLVRTIGDPEIRFREDPIRILRAVKFAARLDFSLESETLRALKVTRNLIPKAAPPRILGEIHRLCVGGAARRSFELIRETGVFEVILPDFAEGYQEDLQAWQLLLDLLDAIDRRHSKGHEAKFGDILAVLMLPLLSRRMGWQEDGTAQRRQGTNVRDMADEFLRPMAERLRLARRDQEYCRQILLTLFRMVPARNLRRTARQSVLRRTCTPDCLWILEVVAGRLGGDFTGAHRYWSEAVADPKSHPRRAPTRSSEAGERAGAGADSREAPKKRRRRPPRRKKAEVDGGQQPAPRKTAAPPKDRDMPPPWDDGYFFAALPTVPEITGEEEGSDRYGAAALAKGKASPPDPGPEENGQAPPKPKRRRRRRRKKPQAGAAAERQPADGGTD